MTPDSIPTPAPTALIRPGALASDAPRPRGGGRTDDIWAMLTAARDGDTEQVVALLARDGRLASCEYWYAQPIHFAVREGHVDVARVLIEAGADLAYRTLERESLLTMARERDRHEMVAYLEGEMQARRWSSGTDHEIHAAARSGDVERVRALVAAEPDLVRQGDARGRTALHHAVQSGSLELVGALLDAGAAIEAPGLDGNGCRPIDVALWGDDGWRRVYQFDMVDLLLARGAAYTITIAAARGDLDRVRDLVGVDPTQVNESEPCGRRPLSVAAERGHLEIVKFLLDHGVDPNLPEGRDCPGGYALYAASRRPDLDMVRLLLEHGADPNADVESSGTPTLARDPEIRALMYLYGGKIDGWAHVFDGNIDVVAALLDVRADVFDNQVYETPFTAAVTNGRWDLLRLLLARGVRVPDVVTFCQGYLWDNIDMTRVLLEHGMNPNLVNWQHVTLLHQIAGSRARDGRPIEAARLLLEFGADIDARDEEYRSTPLGWAARTGFTEMVDFLLEQGAAPSLPDDEPWATPLAWAEKRGHEDVASRLQSALANS